MKMFASICLLLLMMTNLYADDPVTIHVDPGDKTFQVSLPSNPTTGYQWTLKSYDTKLLKFLSSIYTPSKSNLIGAGGTMVFSFERLDKVDVPETTLLEFLYARPWEKEGGTSKTVSVTFSAY